MTDRRPPAGDGAGPQRDVAPGLDPTTTETQPLEVVVVTGLSGAGKNSAGRVLEDLGWFVVDNLPPALLLPMVELGARGDLRRFAAVVDVRSRAFSSDLQEAIRVLAEAGHRPRVVYVHARDEVLVRRYESNRREHPLQGNGTLIDGIAAERGPAHRHRRRGRPVGRHQRPQRPPAARHAGERVRPRGPDAAADGDGHELRLQVRPAAGRRPGGRRPVPAQPALDPRAAPADRPGRRRARLRARPARRRRVPRPLHRRAAAAHPRLPARGQALPDARRRLHRRQAPQRGHRRGVRPAAHRPRASPRPPATATWAASSGRRTGSPTGSSPSAAATDWPRRWAPGGGSRPS